ncbi:MAG: AGE family epimerase/isomerase [Planctomycetes bacterium]|nr:AGE family epimerase/isomerase [Planctomycetota bacterium]
MIDDFRESCRRELLESVVPFWLKHSVDRKYGGVFTCMDRYGTVYDTRKYLWLQGRAVWMFSRLYNAVEKKQEYLDMAASTIALLRRCAFDGEGRMYFALTSDGRPCSQQRKPYSAVFYMQGLAEFYRATGDKACLDEALELYERITGWMDDPGLLGRPVLSGAPRTSSLGTVMTNALMALELAGHSEDPKFTEAIRAAAEKVRAHYDPELRLLREHATADEEEAETWAALPEARFFVPGHSIEVAWFLLKLLDAGAEGSPDLALDIIRGSLKTGWDKEYGGLYYFMDLEGRPTLQLESSMKLWWPHTEAMYALTLAYAKTRDGEWLEPLDRVTRYAFEHFADGEHGEWYGYCDRRGNLTHTCKGGNYKGFYHVPRALLFCWKELEGLDGPI